MNRCQLIMVLVILGGFYKVSSNLNIVYCKSMKYILVTAYIGIAEIREHNCKSLS